MSYRESNTTLPHHFQTPNWVRESPGFLNLYCRRSFSPPPSYVIHDLSLGRFDLRWCFRSMCFARLELMGFCRQFPSFILSLMGTDFRDGFKACHYFFVTVWREMVVIVCCCSVSCWLMNLLLCWWSCSFSIFKILVWCL
jgi:hypothetical protein